MIFHFMYILVKDVWMDRYKGKWEAMYEILYDFRHSVILLYVLGYQSTLKHNIVFWGKKTIHVIIWKNHGIFFPQNVGILIS